MAKILWIGDAGAHTGFARVTHSIGERLVRDHGHDVTVLAINHRGDYVETDLKLFVPTIRDTRDIYGLTRVVEMLSIVEPDVVVMLNDAPVIMRYLFENKHDDQRILLGYRPILAYIPVDGVNHPKNWAALADVTKRVAMTKFGQTQMPEAPVVYHGVDTDIYRPVAEKPIKASNGEVLKSKKDCKRLFGYDPDGFLVLRIDRNSLRKNYPDTISALWPFVERHPDVQVHFHCLTNDPAGYNLAQMLSRRPELKQRFFFGAGLDTFTGWPQEDLAALYNAADVFVSTTYGEGFGLTLAEAVSCGIPVIAPGVSSIPEVVGPGGLLTETVRHVTVPAGQDQWIPDIASTTNALEELYASRGRRRDMGESGRKHVVESLSWDIAGLRFHELITELESTSDPQEKSA